MNRIAVGISCAAVGAVISFGVTNTLKKWEIDVLHAAALRSAAREAEHNEQLRTALGIGEQVQSLTWGVSGISRDVSAVRTTTQDLLKMAQEAAKSSRPPAKSEIVIRRIQPPPPQPPEALEPQKPAAPAPEVKPQAVAGVGIKVDAGAMVDAHNRLRAEVGVPGLGWSDKLAKVAQGWADHLAADNCGMYHSATKYGENVYYAGAVSWSSGRRAMQPISATRPVQMWGAEKQGYYAATGECSAPDGCGHYTQVVWKATTEVGCGMAVCGNKAQIWVCNYFPAGNVAGQKPY